MASDDITWCGLHDCTFKECRRHSDNIRHPEIPHSFALLENDEVCYKKYRTANNRVEKKRNG